MHVVSKKETMIPIIDAQNLKNHSPEVVIKEVQKLKVACHDHGFFYVQNHGINRQLIRHLTDLSHQFFGLPIGEKSKIHMSKGGLAWRGYFSVGEELTSGHPDKKEGLYFGRELEEKHPKVVSKTPMHGRNLFPDIDNFSNRILDYMNALEELGQLLLEGIALSLNLDKKYFYQNYTQDPFVLFRIFNYPSIIHNDGHNWSVGEHTDYGLLTILKQDDVGGLQIKTKGKWIDAPPIKDTFVCNIGDILDIITKGYYKSTPHRVLNKSGKSRLSMPFFMDPNFDAEVQPIENISASHNFDDRWDRNNIYAYTGNYGKYVLNKVSKVFPQLINL